MWFYFIFKQKTAYERRISDWSSDVCSSDLNGRRRSAAAFDQAGHHLGPGGRRSDRGHWWRIRVQGSEFTYQGSVPCRPAGNWKPVQEPESHQEQGRTRSEARRVGNECVSTYKSR